MGPEELHVGVELIDEASIDVLGKREVTHEVLIFVDTSSMLQKYKRGFSLVIV